MCDDAEVTPEPDTSQASTVDLLNQLLAGQKELSTDIAALRAQQASVERLITDLTSRFADLEKQTARIDTIEQTVHSLQAKVVDLEDRSRRSNLIVFGLPEDPKETDAILKQKVLTELFNNKLGVPCSSVGRIHRLGKPRGNIRPVIIFFQNYNEKQEVLQNAHKLKGTKLSIQNDYSKPTLQKRKLLWDSAKNEKLNGKKVTLINDKISIDNELYIWDDTANTRVKLPQSYQRPKKDRKDLDASCVRPGAAGTA